MICLRSSSLDIPWRGGGDRFPTCSKVSDLKPEPANLKPGSIIKTLKGLSVMKFPFISLALVIWSARDHRETTDCATTHDTAATDIPPPVHFSENSSFGLPGWMWFLLFGYYGTFFGAIALATARDGTTVFAIVVSILYTLMLFGTAAVLQGLGKRWQQGFEPGERILETYTGPMGTASVAAQVLTVPVLFAVFAIALIVMRASIGF